MDEHVVHTHDELAAAIMASSQPDNFSARKHPFAVQFGTTRYRFKEGVTLMRAEQIARNIRSVSAEYFQVTDDGG